MSSCETLGEMMTASQTEFDLTRRRIEQRRAAAALEAYKKAVAEGEDSVGCILATAAVCLDQGDNAKARLLLDAGVTLLPVEGKDPRAGELFGMLGIAWARLGHLDETRSALASSINEDDGQFIAGCPEAQAASAKAWAFH